MAITGLNPFLMTKAPVQGKPARDGQSSRAKTADKGEDFGETFAKVNSDQPKTMSDKSNRQSEQNSEKKSELPRQPLFKQGSLAKEKSSSENSVQTKSSQGYGAREDLSSAPSYSQRSPVLTAAPQDSSEDTVEASSEMDEASLLPGAPTTPATPAFPGGTMADRTLNQPTNPFFLNTNAKSGAIAAQQTEGEEAVDGLSRRVVWHEFLRKMKDDLGISAEDVLQAFGSLSDEDLAKPPTQSLEKIVQALGLNDQQALLAKQYFQELIAKTQAPSMKDELSRSSQQINLSLMSQRDVQRRSQAKALDQMSDKFFMKNEPVKDANPQRMNLAEASATSQEEQLTPAEAALPPELRQALSRSGGAAAGAAGATAAAPPLSASGNSNTASALNPKSAKGKLALDPEMEAVTQQDAKVDQLVKKFLSAQAPSQQVNQAQIPQVVAEARKAGAQNHAVETGALASAASLNSMLAKLNVALDDGDEQNSDSSADASYLNANLISDPKLNSPLNSAADFKAQLTAANPNQPMGVADIVQQAQVMVRDGGGEMKVTMTPEGLGEVAMKVSVEKGKVSVQMITESDEARRLIERQLGELKTSLSANHLQVDSIKVDTATNLGKQMEQQYQDAQRQATQQQWEQFRQDNGGWKRSFFETPSARMYAGQSEATRDVPTVSQKRVSSKRLDLVA